MRSSTDDNLNEIAITRKGHLFLIRYESETEPQVLEHIIEMVNDPRLPFTWADAAVMSEMLGEKLAQELMEHKP